MTHSAPGSAGIPLTAIILTHNEAANIGPCLDSLAGVHDIVIVDSGSTDGTREAARTARPDVRWFEHPFLDFGDQRNWALDETSPRHSWILFLDADERVTPKLAVALDHISRGDSDQTAAASPTAPSNVDPIAGYFMCYKNYFLGSWLKRSTYYPSWQLRLLKLGKVRYKKMGHGQMEVTTGKLEYLHEPYDHLAFSKGIADWIARHNKYSSEEAGYQLGLRNEPFGWGELLQKDPVVRRRALKRIGSRLPLRPLARFCYTYFWKLGFLDGRAGLLFCLLRLTHEMHISLKIAEIKAAPDPTTLPSACDTKH